MCFKIRELKLAKLYQFNKSGSFGQTKIQVITLPFRVEEFIGQNIEA